MKITVILYPQRQIVLIFLCGICFDRASFCEDLLTYVKSWMVQDPNIKNSI